MISECIFKHWSPAAVQVYPADWAIMIFYFVTATLAFFIQSRRKKNVTPRGISDNCSFWILIVVAMLFLGINKQLDLHFLFKAIAKCIAMTEGWYANRQSYQIIILITISICSLALFMSCIRYFKTDLKQNSLAIFGLLFLFFFLIIRALSFHELDFYIYYNFHGVRMNWVIEISAISLIFGQSIAHLKQKI